MIDIKEYIMKNRPNLQPSSADAYVLTLKTLHRKLGLEGEVEDLEYLKDTEAILEILKTYQPTTRKNMLNAVIVAMKCDGGKACEKYESQRDEYNQAYLDENKDQQKNAKQKENWMEWEKFEKGLGYFDKEVRRLNLRRRSREGELDYEDMKLMGDYALIKFYHDYPLRNDVHAVQVISQSKFNKLDKSLKNNYLVRNRNNMTLVLRDYKTSKTYGEKMIAINTTLTAILKDWLSVNRSGWMFINEKTGDPMTSHELTRRLHRITKERAGSRAGSTMIRHSYLSSKYAGLADEMEKDAHIMGHSVNVQQGLYVKSD